MSNPDRATIIGIATKDRADILPKSIESALAQRGVRTRVSVIDDGSRDATSSLPARFPSVDWLRWQEPRGYMAARNHWMKAASEEYFVGLDDDAWFVSGDEVGIACQVMNANPRIAVIAFDILSPDKPTTRTRTAAEPASSFIGCGHMLRLTAAREVGGYEEVPGSYGVEEKDLCLRLLDAGYEIVRLPGVHVWHDKTPVARELLNQYRSGVCNDFVMALRRTPGFMLPVALLTKLYRHFVFGIRNGLVSQTLSGLALFLQAVPQSWASRRPVKAATLRKFMRLRPR